MRNKHQHYSPTCPVCKHHPKMNPTGTLRKGELEFEEVTISHDHKSDYTSTYTTIGLSCPKCGVIFKDRMEL